ncbi:MAG TPA: DJ-1/PfpI family protein [Methylovirgula sp.]|nr:DJ-1/PfpI family protein [Methylovirgula sp.]
MIDDNGALRVHRRAFAQLSALALSAAAVGGLSTKSVPAGAQAQSSDAFARLRDKPIDIGILIFPDMDQIDFTGPFEVLSRLPDTKLHVIGTQSGSFRDHRGLVLTPDVALAGAPQLDLLQVPGGPGQQAQMANEPVLAFIRRHMAAGKPLFSVCTGALICGAAGILKGRRATTHWASFDLLPYFGAIPVDERVVIDGNLVSAAGITSGIDGALVVAELLRGKAVAEAIQLDIQYAPEPPFHSGTPKTAPSSVLSTVTAAYHPLTEARLSTARAVAAKLGIASPL